MSAKPDTEKISRTLHSMAIHLLRSLRAQDSALGVGPSQLSALSVIVFAGPSSLHELAEAEQVRPPTMSKIVDALVYRGLVRREVDSRDRRSIEISPTQKGVQMMKEGRDRRERKLIEILKSLTSSEVRDVQRATEILSRALETHQDTRATS